MVLFTFTWYGSINKLLTIIVWHYFDYLPIWFNLVQTMKIRLTCYYFKKAVRERLRERVCEREREGGGGGGGGGSKKSNNNKIKQLINIMWSFLFSSFLTVCLYILLFVFIVVVVHLI